MVNSEGSISIEELSEIYRVEKKSRGISTVRPDLYKSMAECYRQLRRDYDEALRKNPDSLSCEGLNVRRRRCQQLSHDIIDMRMRKICQMALRGAVGGTNSLEALTSEETAYYENILALSKSHYSLFDRLSGNVIYANQDLTTIAQKPAPAEIAIPVPPEEPPVIEEEYYEPEDDIPLPPAEDVPVPPAATPAAADEPPMEVPLDIIPEMGEFDMDEEPEQEIPEDELDAIAPHEPISKEVKTEESDRMLVRILADVAEFSGYTRNYSAKEKQVLCLPTMFAQLLINNNLAEPIKYSP